MKSRSASEIPERATAARAASVPRSAVPVPGSTNRRSRTPVRCTIQSSVVSIRSVRSALVTTRLGRALPVPRIFAPLMGPSPLRSNDQDGGREHGRILVAHDRRLGDVEGAVDLPADLPHLLLLVPALLLVELDAQRGGEHRGGDILGVIARDFFGLAVGVVLAQVAVHVPVGGQGAPYRCGDEPSRLVALA